MNIFINVNSDHDKIRMIINDNGIFIGIHRIHGKICFLSLPQSGVYGFHEPASQVLEAGPVKVYPDEHLKSTV